MTFVRVSVRLQRFELLILGSGLVVLAVLAAIVAGQLNRLDVLSCIAAGAGAPDCLERLQAFGDEQIRAAPLELAVAIVAAFAGVILGAPLVAREIERGSAPTAWALAGTRRRWIMPRALVIGLILACLTLVPVLAAHALEAAARPKVDPALSMVSYDLRGPVVVARALAAFCVAMCVGALLGRALPAVLVGSLLILALTSGVRNVTNDWLRAEALPLANPLSASPATDETADLIIDVRYRDDSGRLLTPSEVASLAPIGGIPVEEQFELVSLGIPGSRWLSIAGRESLLYLAAGVIALAATSVIIERRRPY